MKKNILKPLRLARKTVEKITGYEINVTDPNGRSRKKTKFNTLIKKEMIEKKELIVRKNRDISTNTEKMYFTNKSFSQVVDYTNYYEILEVRDNTIFYESFHGKNMTCNPYAIFKTLIKDPRFSDFHHVWALNNLNDCPKEYLNLPNVEFVRVNSEEYLQYLASCKYLINNTSFPPYFIKKEGQIYVNTWHGTPLKTLGKDMEGSLGQHKNLMRNFLHTDYLVSPNKFTIDKIIDSHDLRGIYNGQIIESGYPRIDLVKEDNNVLANKLNIKTDKKVILYAPTWRGEVGNVSGEINKIIRDMRKLKSVLGKEYVILLKVHTLMQKYIKQNKLDFDVVPDKIDSNELFSDVDILVTDYSSIFFDFLATKKPVIFYAYDREEYERDRGFYLNLDDMPGAICSTIESVIKEIKNASNYQDVFNEKLDKCINEFLYLEDGASTQRVIDTVFFENKQHTYSVKNDKKTIVMYCGGFLNNGVTTSAVNLMNNIDYERYNVIVADKSEFDEESSKNFMKLNNHVKKLYRVGSMNVSLNELESQNQLFAYAAEQFYKKGPMNYLEEDIITMYKREFKRMFGTVDIDIAIDFSGYVKFWSILFAANDISKKAIFQHNDMMEEYDKIVDNEYKHKENLSVIFPLYNKYDHVIAVSKHTRNKNKAGLSHLVVNSDQKMVYVHNSINYQYVLNAIASVEKVQVNNKEYYIEKNGDINQILDGNAIKVPDTSKFNFVTMGRMSPEKDQIKLIKAFAEFHKEYKDTELYIIGTGELEEEIRSTIKSFGLNDQIHLVGQLDNPFPLIQDCDCFVLSSNHEGQPMVLLECLILNKPIVATDIPGNRSVLENGYGELVENSIEGLVQGLKKMREVKPTFKKFDYVEYNKSAMEMFYSYIQV
ncbi:CDP-glycerol glycerophosphotransferase family protein [Niallia sp. Sow4_A1]|nr:MULTISPECIES: glycosyltransferase [Niallia]EOR24664.1 hypothetical protein A499_07525 [Niallia nealsonii AAU1]MCM3360973.1 CDP-glycerol glycerophosphotransferase family protein [Niallia sp. MER TA 168]